MVQFGPWSFQQPVFSLPGHFLLRLFRYEDIQLKSFRCQAISDTGHFVSLPFWSVVSSGPIYFCHRSFWLWNILILVESALRHFGILSFPLQVISKPSHLLSFYFCLVSFPVSVSFGSRSYRCHIISVHGHLGPGSFYWFMLWLRLSFSRTELINFDHHLRCGGWLNFEFS